MTIPVYITLFYFSTGKPTGFNRFLTIRHTSATVSFLISYRHMSSLDILFPQIEYDAVTVPPPHCNLFPLFISRKHFFAENFTCAAAPRKQAHPDARRAFAEQAEAGFVPVSPDPAPCPGVRLSI